MSPPELVDRCQLVLPNSPAVRLESPPVRGRRKEEPDKWSPVMFTQLVLRSGGIVRIAWGDSGPSGASTTDPAEYKQEQERIRLACVQRNRETPWLGKKGPSRRYFDERVEPAVDLSPMIVQICGLLSPQAIEGLSPLHRSVLKQFQDAREGASGACSRIVLETFEGFVEEIEGETAYVKLQSEHGDILYGRYPAHELAAKGIRERRRFKCETVEGPFGAVTVELAPIPDKHISQERLRRIRAHIRRTLDGYPDDAY